MQLGTCFITTSLTSPNCIRLTINNLFCICWLHNIRFYTMQTMSWRIAMTKSHYGCSLMVLTLLFVLGSSVCMGKSFFTCYHELVSPRTEVVTTVTLPPFLHRKASELIAMSFDLSSGFPTRVRQTNFQDPQIIHTELHSFEQVQPVSLLLYLKGHTPSWIVYTPSTVLVKQERRLFFLHYLFRSWFTELRFPQRMMPADMKYLWF